MTRRGRRGRSIDSEDWLLSRCEWVVHGGPDRVVCINCYVYSRLQERMSCWERALGIRLVSLQDTNVFDGLLVFAAFLGYITW